MNYEELGYMGKYAREYKPRVLSWHRAMNGVFGKAPAPFVWPSAVIVQQKKFPDVSFYQGEINFYDMRQKTDALIIRAGQNEWVDSRFRENWTKAKQYGIKRGSYWFYDDRKSPGRQADIWAGLLRDDMPEMEIYADWENTYGGPYKGLKNVVAFMQAMESRLPGIKIGTYTGYYWFRENSNAVTDASQYNYLKSRPLFLGWYTSNAANVLIPNPWASLFLWQFGTPAVGKEYGAQSAEIDMNYINLTEAEFYRRYGGTPPPPVETGATMQGTVRSGYTLAVRDATGLDTGKRLTSGDKVYGAITNNRIYFLRIYRASGAVEEQPGNAATVNPANPAEAYMTLLNVTEEPPTVPPTATLKHTVEIFSDGSLKVDGNSIP